MAIFMNLLKKFRKDEEAKNTPVPSWIRLLAGIIVYLVYILIGAAIISEIEKDDEFTETGANAAWNFGSSMYFFVVTTTTIGYGDISPQTKSGRAFIAIYGLVGLGLIGYVISMTGALVMDFLNWQRRAFFTHVLRRSDAEKGNSVTQKGNSVTQNGNSDTQIPWIVRHSALVTALFGWLLFLFVGAAVFSETERDSWDASQGDSLDDSNTWNYGNSLWFCWVTLTTVGYGDFYPTSNAGKVLLPLYAVLSLGVVGIVIGEVGEAVARSAEKALVGSGRDDSPVDAKIASESIKGASALARSLSGGRRFDSREVRRDTVAALRSALAAAENARVGDSPASSSSSSSDASSSSSYASNSSSYASRSIGGVEDGSYSDYSYSEEDYSY